MGLAWAGLFATGHPEVDSALSVTRAIYKNVKSPAVARIIIDALQKLTNSRGLTFAELTKELDDLIKITRKDSRNGLKLTSNFTKGALGEVNLVEFWEQYGVIVETAYKKLPRDQGFDAVGRRGASIVIGEAKFTSGTGKFSDLGKLEGGEIQMSREWIIKKIDELDEAGQSELADEIAKQLEDGTLQKHLVITRDSGRAGGVSAEVQELFDLIIEVDKSGNVLARIPQ